MRCRKASKLISFYLDGELNARQRKALEAHLSECASCRELLTDFKAIAEEAASIKTPEPSAGVWPGILEKVNTARADKEAAHGLDSRPGFLNGIFLRPAVRFIALLLLVAGGVFIGLRLGQERSAAGSASEAGYTLAKLDEAEGYYRQAVISLEEALSSRRGEFPPEVIEVFEKNLAVVDATIDACRRIVQDDPRNLEARGYLLAAYMDKIRVIDSAINLEGLASSAATPPAIKNETI